MSARIVTVAADRMELRTVDETVLAVARKVAGRDTWMLSKLGDRGVPEWIESELSTRMRLMEIGEA